MGKLPKAETTRLSWQLGVASALMIALGYPGEIQDDLTQRWFWWALAMLPFCFVVGTLLSGLDAATSKQPESVKGLVRTARYLTVVSWAPRRQRTSRLATPLQMWLPKPSLASSFGPLPQRSPRKRGQIEESQKATCGRCLAFYTFYGAAVWTLGRRISNSALHLLVHKP